MRVKLHFSFLNRIQTGCYLHVQERQYEIFYINNCIKLKYSIIEQFLRNHLIWKNKVKRIQLKR